MCGALWDRTVLNESWFYTELCAYCEACHTGMSHVAYVIGMSQILYESFTSRMDESNPIWMGHVLSVAMQDKLQMIQKGDRDDGSSHGSSHDSSNGANRCVWMCVCVLVLACACVCVCVCVSYEYVRLQVAIRCPGVCVYVYVYVCVRVCVNIWCTCIFTSRNIHIHIYVYIYIYT